MTWFKVDDGFLTHPKVYGIKSGPLALWLRAGCWCAGELTDGRVPARALRGLEAKPAHVKELVDRGLWDPAEDGFQFHDWLDYQPSREQVLKTRNETLQRVRKHRNAVTNAVVTPAPVPVPEPEENQERETRARESSARFEKPPVGEAPPNTAPSEPKPVSSEARCWQLYQQALGTEHLMLPMNHHEALRALASAARAESDGASQGEAFDRAVQRLLGAWLADAYWKKNPDRPRDLRNLKTQLEAGKYARPKSVAKVVPMFAPEESPNEAFDRWAREAVPPPFKFGAAE